MNAVIGTAGHVDHGKSSLIKALTGINPSRLPQELLREMTIDLGFAHFSTPNNDTIGIIDVPGHERFIRNMVSAVWGLDLVLFVVAADEGWAALSAEHLRIISAMGKRQCILVLTKCDLVDQTQIDCIEDEALEQFLATMDIIPDVVHVSAQTRQGIDELKQLIIKKVTEIKQTANQQNDLDNQAHIYVDRVFSVNGIGTTITGTLRGGEINEGDVLTLYPGKQPVKVRSLQSYHTQLKTAKPYARTAIGLKQVNKKNVSRGSCLVANPESIIMSNDWIVQLNPIISAQLKKQGTLEVALGTAHVLAKYYVYAKGNLVRLQLSEAIPAFWGQSLLLIQHGGSHIIGAAHIAWLQNLNLNQRQILQQTLPDLHTYQGSTATLKITLQLALNGYCKQINHVEQPENAMSLGDWWILESRLTQLRQNCHDYLNNSINAITSEELARYTNYPQAIIEHIVSQTCQTGEWQKIDGMIISTVAREGAELPANQQQLFNEIENCGKQGYEAEKSNIVGVRRLLRALTEKNLIVPAENSLFFSRIIYDEIVNEIMNNRQLKATFTVAEARERTGLSRKQLIPLLNRLERDGWVKRVGDVREVCKTIN